MIHRRRHEGLTVLELVAVIAIVSLLVAMLVPAVMKIREHSRMAYCGTMLRSIGQAYHAYATDWKGQIVPMVDVAPNATVWYEALDEYGLKGLKQKAYGSTKSYLVQCPKNKQSTRHSYGQNQFVGFRNWGGGVTYYPTNFSHIGRQAATVLMGEISGPNEVTGDNWWNDLGNSAGHYATPHFGHQKSTGQWVKGKANFLYVDTHVESQQYNTETLEEINFKIAELDPP